MKKTIIGFAIATLGIIGAARADASRLDPTAWRCAYTGDANVGYVVPSNVVALTVDGQPPNDQSCYVQTKFGRITGTWVRLGSVALGR
jgi:hypothetical protein